VRSSWAISSLSPRRSAEVSCEAIKVRNSEIAVNLNRTAPGVASEKGRNNLNYFTTFLFSFLDSSIYLCSFIRIAFSFSLTHTHTHTHKVSLCNYVPCLLALSFLFSVSHAQTSSHFPTLALSGLFFSILFQPRPLTLISHLLLFLPLNYLYFPNFLRS